MNKEKLISKANQKYWESVKKAKNKRDKILLKLGNTCLYCTCGNELTSTNSFVSDEGEQGNNVVIYKCSHCNKESKWNFDLAPCPIKIN